MGRGRRDKGRGELCGRKRAGDYGRAASKGNANKKKGEEKNDKEEGEAGESRGGVKQLLLILSSRVARLLRRLLFLSPQLCRVCPRI